MSAVPVPISTLETGDFPAVCVKTGVPTNLRITTSLSVTPGWTWALLLCGILPFFLVRVLASEKVPATLPVAEKAWNRALTANRITIALLVAIVVSFVSLVAAPFRGPVLGTILVGLIVAEILALISWNWLWIGLANGSHRGEVVLTRVHPDFAHAYGRQVGERRAQAQ